MRLRVNQYGVEWYVEGRGPGERQWHPVDGPYPTEQHAQQASSRFTELEKVAQGSWRGRSKSIHPEDTYIWARVTSDPG